jgi:hypothetical protein
MLLLEKLMSRTDKIEAKLQTELDLDGFALPKITNLTQFQEFLAKIEKEIFFCRSSGLLCGLYMAIYMWAICVYI